MFGDKKIEKDSKNIIDDINKNCDFNAFVIGEFIYKNNFNIYCKWLKKYI